MKNRKLTMVASIILVIAMLFGTLTAAATDGTLETAPTTEVTTTAPADVTTTEPTTQAPTEETTEAPATEPTTEAPTDETTTTADSYYDDSEYESEEEKEAYDEGFWDGYYDGYEDARDDYNGKDYDDGYNDGWDDGYDWGESDGYYDGWDDGYYEGYYDAIQDMENKDVITIFDRWDAFIEDLRERVEYFLYEIRDFFERIFKLGDYAPTTPLDPDADFIPDGTQATLEGDEDAQALCDEFNSLINDFRYEVPADVAITKNVNVGITVGDVPSFVEGIVNGLVENFLIDDSETNYYEAGEYAYGVQPTELYPAGLTEASKTVNADGTTDYKFVVIEEAAYYDGYETAGVMNIDGEFYYGVYLQHDYVADTLYIEVADLDPITISSAEIVYPGATITAKTDAEGRLIAYDVDMPVRGKGTAKVAGINLTASLEGYRNEGFVMDYDV